MRNSFNCVLLILGFACGGAFAAPVFPPHLNPSGQSDYREYIEAQGHKAFAIAPGGSWGWTTGEQTAKAATDKALATCQRQTSQRCVNYSVDDKVVFDAAAWPRLWEPYADAVQARRAPPGRDIGRRMYDLAFKDAAGNPTSLSSLRGKVVVLHFWGAWCPPCRQEMPDLQRLQSSLSKRSDMTFILLQARERFDVSRNWAERQGLRLPLADSGSNGDDDVQFRLAGGGRIQDREIASRFPTTYVLDKRGLVVFSHIGPVHGWPQYEGFLIDVAERSGR